MVLLTRDIVVSVPLVELENNAKKVWAEFELELPGSGSEWRLNNYWKCSENFPTLSKGSSHTERFHSRGQQLCKFIGTKEGVCIRKEFKSHRIGLGHQHGRLFIVWDTNMAAVTSCENTLFQCTLPNMNTLEQLFSVCIEGYVKPICKPLRNACEGAILQCLECQATGNPGKPQDTQNV